MLRNCCQLEKVEGEISFDFFLLLFFFFDFFFTFSENTSDHMNK